MKREFKENDLVIHFKYEFKDKDQPIEKFLYKIICIGKFTDDLTLMVVYKRILDDSIWIRRYDEFISEVDKEKYPNSTVKYRFLKCRKEFDNIISLEE